LRSSLARSEGYDRIFSAIKPFCPGEPRYYLVVDRISFNMFGQSKNDSAFFLDDEQVARPINDDPHLRGYDKNEKSVRLFTISGAIKSLAALIQRS
jgi:hypothetical protein